VKQDAIIFDMDGVLFLSNKAHEQGFRRALKQRGITRFRYADVAGMSTPEALQRLFKRQGIRVTKDELTDLVTLKRSTAAKLLRKRPPVRRGAPGLLRRLAARYRLALATSSSRSTMDLFLSASRTQGLFEAVVSSEDVPKAKPSPDFYRYVLRQLNLRPSRALVVEDAVSGVTAARRAGIRVIGVAGTNSAGDLRRAGAEKVLSDLPEIERYA
jgi:HAD superfamily hydrolase (TIGR01509 family)